MNDIINSLQKLESYILSENYKGYDPYDVLMSPIFKFPVFKSNKFLRFYSQQIFRRIPFNLRKFLGIKKGLNPFTIGLLIQSFTYLSKVFEEKKYFYFDEITKLQDKLILLKSNDFKELCWGYDFDWEARYAKFSAYKPTIVATGFIANALFENYKLTGNEKSLSLLLDSSHFVSALNKTYEGEIFCYSYSPYDKQVVYNASVLGARLQAQVYSINKDDSLKDDIDKSVTFILNHQNENGSWSYSLGDARNWIDNFHSGYVIECLYDIYNLIGAENIKKKIELALDYYRKNFVLENGIAKYYNDSVYPIDSTAIAQTIITLTKSGISDLADKVIYWTLNNMQDEKGYFYYQKKKFYTNKISYMRWSNAWMYLALSYFLFKNKIG